MVLLQAIHGLEVVVCELNSIGFKYLHNFELNHVNGAIGPFFPLKCLQECATSLLLTRSMQTTLQFMCHS